MVYIICILPYEYSIGMMYILWLCIWIFEFILVGGLYQKPGFRFRCLNTSLSSDSVYPFAIWIGRLLWLEAMTMAFSLDMVLGFLFMVLFVLGVELLLGGWIGIILRSDILKRIFLTWFLGECILILSRLLVTLTPFL